MPNRYFHIIDGQREGPFTATQIRARVAAGLLKPHHRLEVEGTAKVYEAHRVRGLFPGNPTQPTAATSSATQSQGDQTNAPIEVVAADAVATTLRTSVPPSPSRERRKGDPTWWEDLVVTGFGFASSTAVAWLSWLLAAKLNFAVYTWMFWFVVPAGAIICGMAAASGYWIGARLFNHRPSRLLLLNIVLVSLSTYFAIHHLHYSNDVVSGTPVSSVMSFSEYLVAVTESMTYSRAGRDTPGIELGKLGWGVALLQVIGFSLGGFAVYAYLLAVPYCDRCAKYFGGKQQRSVHWGDTSSLAAAHEDIANLMEVGKLQEAIDTLAALGEQSKKAAAMLSLELQKCPSCENRRLLLTAQELKGKEWSTVATKSVYTEQSLEIA
jgi:hypothetical protein